VRHSGATASENRSHTHGGTTGGINATHDHGINVRWNSNQIGGSGAQTRVSDVGQVTGDNGTVGGTGHTGTEGAGHGHAFSTGTESAAHEHGFTTGGASAWAHSHTVTVNPDATTAGTSGTDANMSPWIAFNKIIKT